MTDRPPATRATAGLLAATAIWNVLQNRLLPRPAYIPVNLAGTAAVLAAARRLGVDAAALGTERDRLGPGVTTGIAAGAPLAVAILAAARSERLRPFFHDERTAGHRVPAVVAETALRIPLGTALFEEALFRGLWLGWLRGRTTPARAVTLSSALFGLWHLLPTAATLPGWRPGARWTHASGATTAALAGGVVVTGVAGAAFAWLRRVSGSLAAPVVVHAAVNASAFVAAWRVTARPRSDAAG